MAGPARRLVVFAALLGALFAGGWAVGAQFPSDETPSHEVDHVDPQDDPAGGLHAWHAGDAGDSSGATSPPAEEAP